MVASFSSIVEHTLIACIRYRHIGPSTEDIWVDIKNFLGTLFSFRALKAIGHYVSFALRPVTTTFILELRKDNARPHVADIIWIFLDTECSAANRNFTKRSLDLS